MKGQEPVPPHAEECQGLLSHRHALETSSSCPRNQATVMPGSGTGSALPQVLPRVRDGPAQQSNVSDEGWGPMCSPWASRWSQQLPRLGASPCSLVVIGTTDIGTDSCQRLATDSDMALYGFLDWDLTWWSQVGGLFHSSSVFLHNVQVVCFAFSPI